MNTERSTVWNGISIGQGTTTDYAALKQFHYRSGHPGGVKRIFAARYSGPGLGGQEAKIGMVAGIIVEALPSLGCASRSIALPGCFRCGNRHLDAAKLNRDMRTISRVVVHPIFRSVGLAVELVRHALQHSETPYVEALAAMGRVNPFFEKAGMQPFDRPALPDAVRMIAALQRENLRPIDLADPHRIPHSPFLLTELQRFTRTTAPFHQLLAVTRKRLLSQPIYYLWTSKNDSPQRHGDTEKESKSSLLSVPPCLRG